jgi:hypothetical protein
VPEDTKPDGQEILNNSAVKNFPKPEGPDAANEEGRDEDPISDPDAGRDSLVNSDMEEPADTVRPPMGN